MWNCNIYLALIVIQSLNSRKRILQCGISYLGKVMIIKGDEMHCKIFFKNCSWKWEEHFIYNDVNGRCKAEIDIRHKKKDTYWVLKIGFTPKRFVPFVAKVQRATVWILGGMTKYTDAHTQVHTFFSQTHEVRESFTGFDTFDYVQLHRNPQDM